MVSSNYPFQFKRMQYFIKVCFGMIINKIQGQRLKIAGIDIRDYYIRLFFTWTILCDCSRVSTPIGLVIFAPTVNTGFIIKLLS
jgi:ATP-dependent DNA helicase PIF1